MSPYDITLPGGIRSIRSSTASANGVGSTPSTLAARGYSRRMAADRTKQSVIDTFDRAAADYDRAGVDYFGVFGARLVTTAAPLPGQRVLDLGCGRGAVLFPAARAIGPSGHDLGIDAAPKMMALNADDETGVGLRRVGERVGGLE